ncbi:LOG family protein [Limnoglobus roseus]|uniref:AMP nucleosidase n=1 Tax=Limnoglobus roseus TaxID=2598579 RepID=A0A5C1ABJ0_9BACT|nr:LOG family protein [Limnoglobus roseus]QEL16080.1 LOG family protein [Limnoglobus roseus]
MPDEPLPNTAFESILESDTTETKPKSPKSDIDQYVQQIQQTAEKLKTDNCGRGDAKLLATSMKELRHCFRVFAPYRGKLKVTVFGSARTKPDHPAYAAAVEFGRQMAAAGYMVITGAAAGIMEAGHIGAGRDSSFGLNILLPFEQAANPVILDDPKLMNMRYFFTRKLAFVKESDAVALFPGGFGTHDEAFETLTLIQTGKSHIFPLVLVDEPGGDYWACWQRFIEDGLLKRGYISPQDQAFYKITDSVEEAVKEVTQFYRVYHSMRYVRGDLVLRLHSRLSEAVLEKVRTEFASLLTGGTFEQTDALPAEANEPDLASYPRLRFRFDRHNHGRLRQLIDFVNREG